MRSRLAQGFPPAKDIDRTILRRFTPLSPNRTPTTFATILTVVSRFQMRKNRDMELTKRTLVLLGFAGFLASCSQADFSKSGSNTVVSSSSTKPTTPNPTPTNLPNAPLPETPSVTLSSEPCTSGDLCSMEAVLNAPLDQDLTATWATDNTIYEQPAPAGVVYSVPNVNYVPTSGEINFPAGTTRTTIYVQTLFNLDSSLGPTRSIVVQFSNCDFGGTQYNCDSLGM